MHDLHFVAPGLAVGAAYPAELAGRLASDHGISRVVDLRDEACDDEGVLRRHGIRLLHLPTVDTRAVSRQALRDGVAFVCAGLDAGERVLIHCQYAIGQSALLAACVFVARGVPPLDALEALKARRPVVAPTPEQLEALAAYAEAIRTERGERWTVPTVDELGRVVWRPPPGWRRSAR